MNTTLTANQAGQQLSLHDLASKRVLVLGLGSSGLAAVRYAVSREALVEVVDTREQPPALAALQTQYSQVAFQCQALDEVNLDGLDLIIWSPGISIERGAGAALYTEAREAGVPVVGELDVFMQALSQTVAEAGEAALLAYERQQAERKAVAQAEADAADAVHAERLRIEAEVQAEADAKAQAEADAQAEAQALAAADEVNDEAASLVAPQAGAADEATASDEAGPVFSSQSEILYETDGAPGSESESDTDTDAGIASDSLSGRDETATGEVPEASVDTPAAPVFTAAREASEIARRALAGLSVSETSVAPTAQDDSSAEDEASEAESAPPPELMPQVKVLAVTGTNGKTTVCSLAREMVEATGAEVRAVGNIGPTMLDAICDARESNTLPTLWILELSSFQLALSRQFDPDVAVILNLTPDHLDWHESMASYAAAKRRIAGPQTHLILPAGKLPEGLASLERKGPQDGMTKAAARAAANAAPQTSFGLNDPVAPGDTGIVHGGGIAWLAEAQAGDLPGTVKRRGEPEPPIIKRLMPVEVLQISGEHNHRNALAALALCRVAGLPMASMLYALRQYRGERHRCEMLARVNDVVWYNDSKGTNVGASCAAMKGLPEPLWLIAGGVGKDQDFTPLAAAVRENAVGVILIGQAAAQIRLSLESTGVPVHDAADLAAAVAMAGALAEPGEAVLLSPACSSFDMFSNYQERGDVFARAVQTWGEDQGQMMELPC